MKLFINFFILASFSLGAVYSLEGQTKPVPSLNAPVTEEGESPEMAAWMIETKQVAKDYVEGIDKGQYAQSWTKGDQLFQQTISQDGWNKALTDGRKSLGNVKSRTLKLQRPAWNPQGLPKGPYMVVEYETTFDKDGKKVELLTLRRGADGKWKVLTYQVD